MYDTFIFDNDIEADRSTVNEANGFSVKKVGGEGTTSLAGNVKLSQIIGSKGRHQRLVNVKNPLISKTDGITSDVYEIVNAGKTVGHVLEIKLVPGVKNTATFKSRITEKSAFLVEDHYHGSDAPYNYTVLVNGGHVVLKTDAQYRFLSRMLYKQTVSKEAAKKLQTDFNAEAINGDAFDDNEPSPYSGYKGSGINNSETAYDRSTRSVVFRLNVNEANVRDVDGDIGKFILKDVLPYEFKLVPIKKDATNPEKDKYFLAYKGKPATVYPDTNAEIYSQVSSRIVKAVGNALTDDELEANGIRGEVLEGSSNVKNQLKITFDKMNGPYVIYLKAELRSDIPNHTNVQKTETNTATMSIEPFCPTVS